MAYVVYPQTRAAPMTAGKHKRNNRNNKKNRRVAFDVSEDSHEEWTTTGTPEEKSKSTTGSSLLKRIDSFLKEKSTPKPTVPLRLPPPPLTRKKSQMSLRDLLDILDRKGGNDQESVSTLWEINERIESQSGYMTRLQMREDFITLGLNVCLHRYEKSRKTSTELWREINRFREGEKRDAAAEGERREPIDVFWAAYSKQREGGHSNLVLDLLERLSHRPFTQHELQVLTALASPGRESLHAIPSGIVQHASSSSSSSFPLSHHMSPSASPPPSDPEIRNRDGEMRAAKKDLFDASFHLEETNIRPSIPRRARSASRRRPSKHTLTAVVETRMPPLTIDCSPTVAGRKMSTGEKTDISIVLSPRQKISSGIVEFRRQESAPSLQMTPKKLEDERLPPLPSPILRVEEGTGGGRGVGEQRTPPTSSNPLPLYTSTPSVSSSLPSISKNAPPPPPLPATPSTSTTTTADSGCFIPSISTSAPPPPPLPGSSSSRIPPPPPLPPPGGLMPRVGGGPPPPPPPPPPFPPGGVIMRGGGPPPPPPLPGFFASGAVTPRFREQFKKERNTMSVLWESVPSLHDESLWSERSEADINEDEMEELQRSFERPKVVARSARDKQRSSAKETTAYALTHQRAMNIEITLKKIKKETEAPYETMLNRLEGDEMDSAHVELLGLIIKHYPTDNELAPFKPISLDVVVGEANRFCWHLSRKPILRVKAQLLIAKETLNADLKSQEATLATLQKGIGAAKSNFIKNFLQKVLDYGNYLNQGTFHRTADGFAISSLVGVLNTKGHQDAGGKRIVEVLAKYMEVTSKKVMEELATLATTSKIDLDEVEKSLNETKQSLAELQSALRKSEDDELQHKYKEFIEECAARCVALVNAMKEIRDKECALRVYFSVPTLSLKRIIEILVEALELFKKSVEACELVRFRSVRLPPPRKDSTLGAPAASLMSTAKRRQSMMMSVDETSRLFSRALNSPTISPTVTPFSARTVTPPPPPTQLPTIASASEEVEI